MMPEQVPIRVFVARSDGTIMTAEASPAVSEAWDILVADGMSPWKAAELAVGMDRIGADPVAQARKMVRLRKAARK